MTPLTSPKTRSITDVLSADEARTFLDLVRIAQQRVKDETLEIRDEEGMIWGCLWFLECHAPPPEAQDDPEFLKELERRMQSPEPAILYEDGMDILDIAESGGPQPSVGQESPELMEELARRMASSEPALPVEEVIAFLQTYLPRA